MPPNRRSRSLPERSQSTHLHPSLLVAKDAAVEAVEHGARAKKGNPFLQARNHTSASCAVVLGRTTSVSNITCRRPKCPAIPILTLPFSSSDLGSVASHLRPRPLRPTLRLVMRTGQAARVSRNGKPTGKALSCNSRSALLCALHRTRLTSSAALISPTLVLLRRNRNMGCPNAPSGCSGALLRSRQ